MKKWFLERFLPMWAKETILRDYRDLQVENEKLKRENEKLRAYIKGVQAGQRAVRKLRMNN